MISDIWLNMLINYLKEVPNMGIIVQKYGGSSVENTEKLFYICRQITKEYDKGNSMVVVVSAQR